MRVSWPSTNSFGAGLWIELTAPAAGRVVFRDREDYGVGRGVARSLPHFFQQYVDSLQRERVTWDATKKRVTFGRKALVFAFSP
ncbi:MAG: hypothetical protein JNJ54_14725 [Myxococcaceae bacterium]|nr:hypothetical protein [Myxococcaceae bacterium]